MSFKEKNETRTAFSDVIMQLSIGSIVVFWEHAPVPKSSIVEQVIQGLLLPQENSNS